MKKLAILCLPPLLALAVSSCSSEPSPRQDMEKNIASEYTRVTGKPVDSVVCKDEVKLTSSPH